MGSIPRAATAATFALLMVATFFSGTTCGMRISNRPAYNYAQGDYNSRVQNEASLEARGLLEEIPLFKPDPKEIEPLYCYHCKGEFSCKNDARIKICEAPYRTCQTIYADSGKRIVVAKDCGYDYGCELPTRGEYEQYPNAYVKCHCLASFCNWYPRANVKERKINPLLQPAEAVAIDPW